MGKKVYQGSSWRPELSKSVEISGAYGGGGYYGEGPFGRKMSKACGKHRADHSNPGGVVSEFFRQKRSRI